MRNYIVFNGINCSDFGVYVSGQGTYDSPTREYEAISVPGRNGDILSTEKRFDIPGFYIQGLRKEPRGLPVRDACFRGLLQA